MAGRVHDHGVRDEVDVVAHAGLQAEHVPGAGGGRWSEESAPVARTISANFAVCATHLCTTRASVGVAAMAATLELRSLSNLIQ